MSSNFRRYLTPFRVDELPVRTVEVAVVGSGVAGLRAARAISDRYSVEVFTKDRPKDSNTWRAQGGVAAALSPADSPGAHLEDTLAAGAGLCDRPAVEKLVNRGPVELCGIADDNTEFNRSGGELDLGREGGHGKSRVAHARGDATGEVVEETLLRRVRADDGVSLAPGRSLVDLVVESGRVSALLVLGPDGLELVRARGVVLATGGLGQVYRETTNHPVVTGDGMAAGLRAGLGLRDLEFVQFHPTVLYLAGAPRFLITEALRGEGAHVRDVEGNRFLEDVHPDAELAPRDVVSRGILERMIETDSPYVYLDVTHLGAEYVKQRFPKVTETCSRYGIDLNEQYIPIRPCAHYSMGGVRAGIDGRTELENLFCVGEVASTGVHGANRLASNSLLEGLVAGAEAGELICDQGLPPAGQGEPAGRKRPGDFRGDFRLDFEDLRKSLQSLLWRQAGILRNQSDLEHARSQLRRWLRLANNVPASSRAELETLNMLYLGRALVEAALEREESRGAHYREDYPDPDESRRDHSLISLDQASGQLTIDHTPVET